ncbi:hypothetical protein RYX36_002597 [Vicia faba]
MGKIHGSLARARGERVSTKGGQTGQEEEAPWSCSQAYAVQSQIRHCRGGIWQEEADPWLFVPQTHS